MEIQTLIDLGFTRPQARAYIALIKSGSLTPPELSAKIKETRSNSYKILDRLVELGVASRQEESKKLVYRPENPITLETQAKKARDNVIRREKQVKEAMPTLLNYFYTFAEQPGVRFFQGPEGLQAVFDDIVRTGQTQYLLRSPSDVSFYDQSFFANLRSKKRKAGIKTIALTPDVPSANHDPAVDLADNLTRTWLPKDAYAANVEWSVYGNKLAIISYGEEAIATIIDSPQIAEAFKQMFELMRLGAER